MTRTLFERLALPCTMAACLFLGLAYWWLDNLPHEIFGIVMFALLIRHIITNRTWFRNLVWGGYDLRRAVVVILHVALMLNMAVLLITSVMISKSVFAALPLPDTRYLREIHWLSAYWVVLAVGIHLGIHWTRVMALVRRTLKLEPGPTWRTLVLRLCAATIAVFGAWSFHALGVWTKLTFNYSLEFWDFTSAVTPFFAHWTGVVGLFAVVTHYALLMVRSRRPAHSASLKGAGADRLPSDIREISKC